MKILRGVALDLAAWYAAPAVFLWIYLHRYMAPADALAPHLRVVLTPLVALALLRLILAAFASPKAARLTSALAAAALLWAMLAYYLLVLIGLQSWGRVISWEIIVSYAGQAGSFADALGISVPLVLGAALLAFLALFAGAWLYFGRVDWAGPAAARLSKPLVGGIAVAGVVFCAAQLDGMRWDASHAEPVALTLHPLEADFQGHGIDQLRAARLDQEEDAARAAYRPAPPARRRNLVLIVVDALRPDHLGIYGYARDTTPFLSRQQGAGRLRKNTMLHASCSSSECGLQSIASSKFLHQFSDRPITLQEVVKLHGYRVHMMLSGNHSGFYGLRRVYQGADSFFDGSHATRYMNDDRLVIEHLAAFPQSDGKPAMFQFHLMSAHLLGMRDLAFMKFAPAESYALNRGQEPSESAVNYYDNGVLLADAMIEEILRQLKRKGYLEDAVVAITADHGEALGEHGQIQHSNSVREEALRVPFVLLSYGGAPTSPIDGHRLAAQIDIAPTLLQELGLPRPATWQGEPLQKPLARDFIHFRERWESGVFDLRDPRALWKYWFDSRTGAEYAFDLAVDPHENVNVIGAAPLEDKRAWRRQILAGAAVGIHFRYDADRGPCGAIGCP
jgi:glucan phosphoethanolaminetransferase (alkaline phosphatase superfamily)